MGSTSPTDGRAAQLETARKALGQGRGVLVIGEQGSGRSRFVRDVIARLDEATRARLWLGDELQRLDDEQAGRLARAVTGGTVLPLATVAAHRPLALALDTVWRDHGFIRIELTPLNANELLGVVEQFLGGPLDPRAVSAFVPRRGGIDLVALREGLGEAQKSGILAEVDGSWRLSGPIPPSESLRRMLLSRVGFPESATPLTETTVDLLGLIPEVGLDTASQLALELRLDGRIEDEFERLEGEGAVEVLDQAGGPRLHLRDGVIELLVPQTIGVLRRRRLTIAIVDVLGRVPPAELGTGEIVALAKHALALGRELDAESLTRAARASLRGPDMALSLTLSVAAVEGGGGFDAEMALAAAESQVGRSDDALARLERLVTAEAADVQRGEALTALMLHAIERAGDPSFDLALQPGADGIDPATSLRIDAIRGLMLNTLGDSIGATELIEPALAVLSGEELAHAYYVIANGSMLTGRLARAREALQSTESILSAAGLDSSRVHLTRAFLDSFEGRISQSLVVVEQFRDAAGAFGQWAAQAMCSWAVGSLLLFAGRAPEAASELRAAIAGMERIGITRTALLVRTDLATVLAFAGDEAGAFEALSPALNPPTLVFDLEGKALQALGWIHACGGRFDDAASSFVRAADAYGAPGHDLGSLIALVDAARVGAARAVLPRIEALAVGVEGVFAEVSVRHARALALAESLGTDDEADAAQLATEFDQIGQVAAGIDLHMLAAEAFARAATLHRSSGTARSAAASARRRDEQLTECGLENLPLVVELTTSPLSERELEIANLAADGMTNRQIADQLVLSVRTVETHLQRVYQKLGVRGRSEVGAAL